LHAAKAQRLATQLKEGKESAPEQAGSLPRGGDDGSYRGNLLALPLDEERHRNEAADQKTPLSGNGCDDDHDQPSHHHHACDLRVDRRSSSFVADILSGSVPRFAVGGRTA